MKKQTKNHKGKKSRVQYQTLTYTWDAKEAARQAAIQAKTERNQIVNDLQEVLLYTAGMVRGQGFDDYTGLRRCHVSNLSRAIQIVKQVNKKEDEATK